MPETLFGKCYPVGLRQRLQALDGRLLPRAGQKPSVRALRRLAWAEVGAAFILFGTGLITGSSSPLPFVPLLAGCVLFLVLHKRKPEQRGAQRL